MAIPSSKNQLLLLLVAIAAALPHFSTTSVFALAAKSSDAEAEECKDKEWVGKITKKGEKYLICDWVALKKTKQRCKKVIKRNGIRKKKNGETKKVTIEVKPWKYCGCVCKDYQPEEEDDTESEEVEPSEEESEDEPSGEEPVDEASAEEKLCPAEILESNEARSAVEQRRSSTVKGSNSNDDQDGAMEVYADKSSFVNTTPTDCIRDGYEKWRICSYEFLWIGCTYDELRCLPKAECTCGPDFISNGREWKCKLISYEECQEPPRPAPGDPIPIGIPKETGTPCSEVDPQPRPSQEQRSGILGI